MTPIYFNLTRSDRTVTAHVIMEQSETASGLTGEAETTAFCDCLNRFGSIAEALEMHAGEYNMKYVSVINGRYYFKGGCTLEDIVDVLTVCGFKLIIKQ